MKITRVAPFILHVPVTRNDIADSTHRITHWGAPGVILETENGLQGYGYTGTHAHLATDRLIASCIGDTYGPLLLGEDAHEVQHIWQKLLHFPPVQWVGRGGITHLALSAIDIALWDLKAKAAGVPLWKLLGGSAGKRLIGYNTDGGWLNWPLETLISDTKRLVEEEGYTGVKIKVGSPQMSRDLERIEAVRKAIGPERRLMVDANGRFDFAGAALFGRHLEDFGVEWFEEPIWYDDVDGHARLAKQIRTPIALGEQLYSADHFAAFIRAQAMTFVQPDAVRLAGVTEWWQVADLAHSYRLPVVAHVGDMAQVHVHLSIAHRACTMLEYIPWLRDCFVEPACVREGAFVPPETAGAGTTLREGALEQYGLR
ncbi:MAG TPA: mandelate racemase/muconate lactonizing enzyme family protein [Bryobacteraceae bacterium]|jgi:L-alanine-DL-glutamate epimerase-like enolase superfamily enzyme